MKRFRGLVLGLALVAGLASMSLAATPGPTADFINANLTVTIMATAAGIRIFDVTDPSYTAGWGNITAGSGAHFSNLAPRVMVQNVGIAPTNIEATVSSITGGMGIAAAPADNVAEIQAIYTVAEALAGGGRDLVAGDFGAEDTFLVINTYLQPSATVLFSPNDAGNEPTLGGLAVPPSSVRFMRFAFTAPTAASVINAVQQAITITYHRY